MMSNIEKLKKCFVEALVLPPNAIIESLAYENDAAWDSVGHMRLVAAIESAFNIMFSTDEILDLSDFNKAQKIVSGHGISWIA